MSTFFSHVSITNSVISLMHFSGHHHLSIFWGTLYYIHVTKHLFGATSYLLGSLYCNADIYLFEPFQVQNLSAFLNLNCKLQVSRFGRYLVSSINKKKYCTSVNWNPCHAKNLISVLTLILMFWHWNSTKVIALVWKNFLLNEENFHP